MNLRQSESGFLGGEVDRSPGDPDEQFLVHFKPSDAVAQQRSAALFMPN
jgi:hypothetical protein